MKLPLSSFPRWFACPGSAALEAEEKPAAADPTEKIVRFLAYDLLTVPKEPASLRGTTVEVDDQEFTATDEQVVWAHRFAESVRQREVYFKQQGATEVLVRPEQRLDLDVITAEFKSFCIAPAVIIASFDGFSVLSVEHIGMTEDPDLSAQSRLMALAACIKYGLMHTFQTIHSRVMVPTLHKQATTWQQDTHEELYAWGEEVSKAAGVALGIFDQETGGPATAVSHLVPGEQCLLCRAKPSCPAVNRPKRDDFDISMYL